MWTHLYDRMKTCLVLFPSVDLMQLNLSAVFTLSMYFMIRKVQQTFSLPKLKVNSLERSLFEWFGLAPYLHILFQLGNRFLLVLHALVGCKLRAILLKLRAHHPASSINQIPCFVSDYPFEISNYNPRPISS